MSNKRRILTIVFLSYTATSYTQNMNKNFIEQTPSGQLALTIHGAQHFAGLALNCIKMEFPNKPGHVILDSSQVLPPRSLHPAFYGCFDWHSAVHGHWMLVRLLKIYPHMPMALEIRAALSSNLSKDNLLREAEYFRTPGAKTFERTYGWAWLLKLAEELHTWNDPDGIRWREAIEPLESVIVKRLMDFLPIQTYPIRTGEHPNTAFGLSFAWDYAQTTGNILLKDLVELRSRDYFLNDVDCPAAWEPGGSDFLSPCLEEADLMRRVLPERDFRRWLKTFLPGMEEGNPPSLFSPAEVSDRTDPKIVHLDGLNLSRSWCLYGISHALFAIHNPDRLIDKAARAHLENSLPYIASGDYAGEHWLASFAVYALSQNDQSKL